MSLPMLGAKAPAFTTVNQRGDSVSLDSFSGKNLVLYFYPKALTPGCTTQACDLRDAIDELAALDTVVLGISPDPVARLQKFVEREGLNFDLLADEGHLIAEKYGVWGLKKFMGREYLGIIRTTFIIGKDGNIKQVMSKVNTKRHCDQLLTLLAALD